MKNLMTTNNREGRCCPKCNDMRSIATHRGCDCGCVPDQQSLEGKGCCENIGAKNVHWKDCPKYGSTPSWEREFDERFPKPLLSNFAAKQFIRQRDAELVGAIKELKCRKQAKLDEFVDCAHNKTLDQAISTIEGRMV